MSDDTSLRMIQVALHWAWDPIGAQRSDGVSDLVGTLTGLRTSPTTCLSLISAGNPARRQVRPQLQRCHAGQCRTEPRLIDEREGEPVAIARL